MRKHWVDNVRWTTVMTVVLYHVITIFNSSRVFGSMGYFNRVQYQDAFMPLVYPWFMILLYVVSGISTRYALDKYSHKEFISSRTTKLLVPSTLGILLFQWLQGYFNVLAASGFDSIPKNTPAAAQIITKYVLSVSFGIGPLWFIHLLWLFSLLIVMIRKIDKNDKLYSLSSKTNTVLVIAAGYLLILGSSQILNAPLLEVYRFGVYFMAFLIGYFFLSADRIQDDLTKLAIPLGIAAAALGVSYTIFYFGQNCTDLSVLRTVFTNVYAWTAVIAVIGCGKRFFDKENKFTRYMSRISWGIYTLHYVAISISAYYLYYFAPIPTFLIYLLTGIITIAGSVGMYELFSRIPVIRWIILGIKKKDKKIKKQNKKNKEITEG